MVADVTVIVPHYNALDTIGRSIDSVVSQRLGVREIIIVDDASEDIEKLAELISTYDGFVDVRLVRLSSNRGAGHARNVGVRLATSKYLAFLDADDVWHPQKIEIQYGFMKEFGYFLTGHDYIFDLNGSCFNEIGQVGIRSVSTARFAWGNMFFTPSVMVRRESFVLFDEQYRRMEDYKCWFENKHGRCFGFIKAPLAGGFKAPIGESGLSGSVQLMHDSYILVLRALASEKKMTPLLFMAAMFFECVKYPLRQFRVTLKKAIKAAV